MSKTKEFDKVMNKFIYGFLKQHKDKIHDDHNSLDKIIDYLIRYANSGNLGGKFFPKKLICGRYANWIVGLGEDDKYLFICTLGANEKDVNMKFYEDAGKWDGFV